jgi:translation initiation factor 2B subunit (eIF-2B alpha/beta/delta family)
MVTESRPDFSGYVVAKELKNAGLVCKLVLDAAVGTYMNEVRIFIFISAE